VLLKNFFTEELYRRTNNSVPNESSLSTMIAAAHVEWRRPIVEVDSSGDFSIDVASMA
jgi:hypothetical protein